MTISPLEIKCEIKMFHFIKTLEGNCMQLGQGYNLFLHHSHCFVFFQTGDCHGNSRFFLKKVFYNN